VGISQAKMNFCLSIVFLYLLGRAIPLLELMWGRDTLSAVIGRLEWYETKKRQDRRQKMLEAHPRMSIFLCTDDSGGRHGVGTHEPHIDDAGTMTVERDLLGIGRVIKKKDIWNAQLNKQLLVKHGYPLRCIDGGDTDHPAESEIRLTVALCHEDDPDYVARHAACGNHKGALTAIHIMRILCADKGMHQYCHKQFGFVARWVWVDGKKYNTHIVSSFAKRFMGGDGWWCNIPKVIQDQR
jgi:hypothetical protein